MSIKISMLILLFSFSIAIFVSYGNLTTKFNNDLEIENLTIVNKSAEDVVVEYCNFAKAGKFDEIKNIVTMTPAVYWEYSIEKESGQYGKENPHEKTSNDKHNKSYIPLISMTKHLDDLHYNWVSASFPSIKFNMKVRLDIILQKWIKGDTGRVRAKLVEEDSGFSYEEDFFVIKENNAWKIFKVQTPTTLDNFPM